MKKLVLAAFAALVMALGLVSVSGPGASALQAKPHKPGFGSHKGYPGTIQTHTSSWATPVVPAGGVAVALSAVTPFFAKGTLEVVIQGEGHWEHEVAPWPGNSAFMVSEPLSPGSYTVTATFTPAPGSLFTWSRATSPVTVVNGTPYARQLGQRS